ncbi:MAG TPA: 50S ribosomal protein L11 methyltransferase [Saprospiraceae bacterium]|nr:50S ribosomal protein L11 methyltransferase [Saprospiraceae bacterium]
MAKKLYIFGIGGTGSRVIKSLAMLLAAGVKLENGFDTVVPIIIDPDTENGDLNRTKDILRLYQEVRNQIKNPDDFFKQELKTVNELADPKNKTISPDYFQFKLNDVDSTTFGQYIGFDSLCEEYRNSKDDKSFIKLLYSNSNLNSDLSIGFKGNPNMGSIVLNQFTNSEDFKRFGQTFGHEDAIFIINSIFGGTGAAGFPLLMKRIRSSEKPIIKDAPIGGLTYLPYFSLNKKGEINDDSFEEKAKIAIDYYNRTIINQRKINVLHFIGNRGNTNIEKYAVGGTEQKNKAHFLEIAGALAIVEFCKNITTYLGDLSMVPVVKYDVILANINRNVLLADASDLVARLINSGGKLLLSGILEADFDAINDQYTKLGLKLTKRYGKEGWLCLMFEN